MKPNQELEAAMVKTTKLASLLDIGNCGEVINLIDNDVLPVLNSFLAKPALDKSIPIGFVYDTWLRTNLLLANALCLQGDNRCFDVLSNLFDIIEKHKINDKLFECKAKLVLAYANTMKGDFALSQELLQDINRMYRTEVMDAETVSRWNLVFIINQFMLKQYDGLREILFDSVTFANNIGDNFTKNILKALLGKILKDNKQAKRAVEIYNEQVTYFANEKMALGALLSWYLIADATLITENPKNSIEIASQALEIAQNPRINNYFFIVMLKIHLAKAYMELSDFESAKMNLESAMSMAKKYSLDDLLSKIYFVFAKYNQELGTLESSNQTDYLKGAVKMYDKAAEIIQTKTRNKYLYDIIEEHRKILISFCEVHGVKF